MGLQWDPRGPQELRALEEEALEAQKKYATRLERKRQARGSASVPAVSQELQAWFRDETRERHYIVIFSIIQTMKNQYIDLLNHLFYNKNNEKSID